MPWDTPIGQPIPSEQTLDADDEVFAEWRNRRRELLGIGPHIAMQDGLSGLIEDAHIHLLSMSIDAAVMLMSRGIKSHVRSPVGH
jgi:hypothetical protein